MTTSKLKQRSLLIFIRNFTFLCVYHLRHHLQQQNKFGVFFTLFFFFVFFFIIIIIITETCLCNTKIFFSKAKIENFIRKVLIFFNNFAQNIDCGYLRTASARQF